MSAIWKNTVTMRARRARRARRASRVPVFFQLARILLQYCLYNIFPWIHAFFQKKFNTRPIDQIHKNIWMFGYNFNISIDHQLFIYSLYNQNIHYLLVLNWSDGIYMSVGYICFSDFYASDIISLSKLKFVFRSEKSWGWLRFLFFKL